MEVDLTPEQKEFVRVAVETGRLPDGVAAVEEAMELWVERERRRVELLGALQEADASFLQDEGREITQQSMKTLAEEINMRGAARLAAERPGKA